MANNSLDVVYDNYGAAGTADQAMPALKPGGAFVFLPGKGGALSRHPKEGVRQINYGLCRSTNHTDLEMLRALVQGGQLRPHVQAVFPLADVPAAFRLSMEGHVQGKLALAVQWQRRQH